MHLRRYLALPITLISLTSCANNAQTTTTSTDVFVSDPTSTAMTLSEPGSSEIAAKTTTTNAKSQSTPMTPSGAGAQTNSSSKTSTPALQFPTTTVSPKLDTNTSTIAPINSTPSTTRSPAVPGSFDFECDAESDSAPTFTVPFGSSVKIVVTSSAEREFHLHGYDIELSGTRVTFNFTADIGGRNMVSIHPNHDVVCYINVQ